MSAILKKKFNPSADELWALVWKHPQTYIAKMFGIKQSTLLSRCRKLDVLIPPKGYWRLIQIGRSPNDALKRFGWHAETIADLNKKLGNPTQPETNNSPAINYMTDFDWHTVPIKKLKVGLYFHAPAHPLACKGIALRGLVNLVKHIASVQLGRWLEPQEVVRYKDGNDQNISPDNLIVAYRNHVYEKPDPVTEICPVCQKPFTTSAIRGLRRVTDTKECAVIWRRKKFNPEADELRTAIWQYTQTEVARMFGTDTITVRERCKEFGIITPPVGYWNLIRLGKSHEDALKHLGWQPEEIANLNSLLN